MAPARPAVGLLRVGVDGGRQHILHRQPVSGAAPEVEVVLVHPADDGDQFLARQRQAKGHRVEQLAVACAPAVHDHRIGCIVERLQIDAHEAEHRHRCVPVIDVQCHRCAVGVGQPDAVAVGHIGLRAQRRLAPVPAHGARALAARWDGHKAPPVSDVGVNGRWVLHCCGWCHRLTKSLL